jgi:hypothetical protein
MTETPRPPWETAMDFGIATGRYMLVGERQADWRDAEIHMGPNFSAAPLHLSPLIAAEQQIIDNMLRMQEQRKPSEAGE